MADIEKILRKRKPTGKEVGILAITNACDLFRQTNAGIEEPVPIVTADKLTRMINSLTEMQSQVYQEYATMYSWLILQFSKANEQVSLAQYTYKTLDTFVVRAVIGEDAYALSGKMPVIMTRKQYEAVAQKGVESFLTDGNGSDLRSNVFMLIGSYLSYYLKQMEEQPQLDNPLQALKDKYSNEPVKSNLILSNWNAVSETGYYVIEDGSGRRSDMMTDDEWKNAVVTDKGKDIDRIFHSEGNDEEKVSLWNMRDIIENKIREQGGTQEDIDDISVREGLMLPTSFHISEQQPEGLTKWDVLESDYLMELYPIGIGSGCDGSFCRYGIAFPPQSSIKPDAGTAFTAAMEDFVAEFPELVGIALDEMQRRYFVGSGIDLTQLQISEWYDTVVTWRKLYELGFYGIREEAHKDRYLSGSMRIADNGIAILRDDDIHKASYNNRIAEDGSYIEPQPIPSLPKYTLDAFLPTSPDYSGTVSFAATARQKLMDSLYYLEGYNMQIDMVSRLYDIPALASFKMNHEPLFGLIDTTNTLISLLYREIADTEYSDPLLKMNKLSALQEHFKMLNYKEELKRSPENATIAEEIFKRNMRAFHNEYETLLRYLLFVRGYSYNEVIEQGK